MFRTVDFFSELKLYRVLDLKWCVECETVRARCDGLMKVQTVALVEGDGRKENATGGDSRRVRKILLSVKSASP